MFTATQRIRVEWAHCDPAGIIFNPHYYLWMDSGTHALLQAAAPHLMTQTLMETLVDHAAGNLRLLNNMAAELLARGAEKQAKQLDEKLFLEVFSRQPSSRRNRRHKKTD